MSTIYIARKDAPSSASPFEHLYLIYDQDNDPTNRNEFIIRGGPESDINPLNSPILLEAGMAIDNAVESIVDNPFSSSTQMSLDT